jgi:hypothetical protein
MDQSKKAAAAAIVLLVVLGSFVTSCDKAEPGQRPYDSLFLGFFFGMEKKQFYDYCWEMNRQNKFTHGPANMEVEYRLNELDNAVMMRFYPSFHRDRIYEMPVTFTYEAWAPWNRSLQADSLLERMLPVFEKWYGEGFRIVQHPSQGKVYVKRDGYRRINLFIRDDQFVQAVITDMDAEIEKNKEESGK